MPYYTVFMWEKISDLANAAKINDLDIPDMSINLSYTINTTATGTGLTYKYTYKYPGGSETLLRDYSSTSNCTFTPSQSGNATITVYVKNSAGTIVNHSKTVKIAPKPYITYAGHCANIGWQDYVSDSQTAGTTGKSYSLQAIKIKINDGTNYKLTGKVYVNSVGYISYNSISNDATTIGTTNRGLQLETIQLSYSDPYGYKLQYRVHMSNIGWMDWIDNGNEAGKRGYRMEAIEIRLVKK